MPRVNIYLPQELADGAKSAELNVSALAQEAVRQALGANETDEWLKTVRGGLKTRVTHDALIAAFDESRDEDEGRLG